MSISHFKSDTVSNATGTLTVYNSQGSTTTMAATDLIRPQDWNSNHFIQYNLGGNTTGQSSVSGADVTLYAGAGIQLSGNTAASGVTIQAAPYTASWTELSGAGATVTSSFATGSVYMRPFELDNYLNADLQIMQISHVSNRTTVSFSGSVSSSGTTSGAGQWLVSGTNYFMTRVQTAETAASFASLISASSITYTYGGGVTASLSWSTNVSSATVTLSTTAGLSYIANIDSAGGSTTTVASTTGTTTFSSTSTGQNSFSSSFVVSGLYNYLSGLRAFYLPMPGSPIMVPGEYWLGIVQASTTASTNLGQFAQVAVHSAYPIWFTAVTQSYLELGDTNAIRSTSAVRPGHGSYVNSPANFSTNIALSNIATLPSNMSLYFAIAGRTK